MLKAGKNAERAAENRQLVELFQTKEWSAFETLLDKCVSENGKNMDFSVLDRPVLFEANHPLMLIARSGQERLIKHEAVLTLLNLKWRFIPRFVFYFNLIFVLVFLALVTWLAVELGSYRCACRPCVLVGSSVSGMEETGNYSGHFWFGSFGNVSNQTEANEAEEADLGFECSVDGAKRNKSDLLAIECEVYDEFGVIFDLGNCFYVF